MRDADKVARTEGAMHRLIAALDGLEVDEQLAVISVWMSPLFVTGPMPERARLMGSWAVMLHESMNVWNSTKEAPDA